MPMTSTDLTRARRFLADLGTSEQQTISLVNVTGGTFTITWNAQTTASIVWNAPSSTVQNALAALSNVGTGNVSVNNTNPWAITWGGALAGIAQNLISIGTSSLQGSNVQATVTEVLAGGIFAFTDSELNDNYDLAASNFFLGIAYGYRQILGSSAKLNNYSAGQTSESKDQVFQHVMKLAEHFEQWSQARNQAQVIGMRSEPPRKKARPFNQGGARNSWGPGWSDLPFDRVDDSWGSDS